MAAVWAADARCAGGVQDVAADRADVQAAAQQVGGTVRVGDDLAGEQLRQRDAQRGGQRLQQGDVGQAAARLPLGDGLVADAELVGQLGLGQAAALPQGFDGGPGNIVIHGWSRSFRLV